MLRHSQYGALVGSNTLTALGSGMQQLLQGWLIVAWGHSLLFLLVFGVARVLPKVALTIPAGIVCDRVPRLRVLLACRAANVFASLLPLVGLLLPVPLLWLLVAIALGGALHAFDLPAGRAVLGDVTAREDLRPVISLSHGGSHLAALIGPPLAFLLGPSGLVAAAALFAAASLLTLVLQPSAPLPSRRSQAPGADVGELLGFVAGAPTAGVLVVLGVAPGIIDKSVALALPSVSSGTITGVALLAPELGALIAAVSLSFLPVRFSLRAMLLAVAGYALLLGLAFRFAYEPELLITGLFVAGVAKLAFNTASQTRLQESIPPALRGRVLSI